MKVYLIADAHFNHDQHHSCTWWMEKGGFDFACDSRIFRGHYLAHKPPGLWEGCSRPEGSELHIHGHLHNVWDGFRPNKGREDIAGKYFRENQRFLHAHQRLFAVEYTNYMPAEFEKFVSYPSRYQARGPRARTEP